MNYGDTLYTIIVHEIDNSSNERWMERGYREAALKRFPIKAIDSALYPTVGSAMRAFNEWDAEENTGDWQLSGVYSVNLIEDAMYGYIVNVNKVAVDTDDT